MTTNYAAHVAAPTPQSEPLPGREHEQVKNAAGGFVFLVTPWVQLERFLILGTEGGTYYASERKITRDAAQAAAKCLNEDGVRAVQLVVDVSVKGRAPKHEPGLLVLAMAAAHSSVETRRAALGVLSQVARTATHLFTFLEYVQSFRGWGRGLRRAVDNWYGLQAVDALAYQMIKYRQRNGWTHRDALRLTKPAHHGASHEALYRWATKNEVLEAAPRLLHAFVQAQACTTPREAVALIAKEPGLSWEMFPTEILRSADVWAALLPRMPLGALTRNLARMTANGAVAPLSESARIITDRLADGAEIRKARLHPVALLAAACTYGQGHGERGELRWTPVPQVRQALDGAFRLAFDNVTPTGKRMLLALDVSGSMDTGTIAGVPGLTPRVGAAAMALVTAATEKQHHILGFTAPRGARGRVFGGQWGSGDPQLQEVPFHARSSLTDVVAAMKKLPMGGTDCSIPMRWALDKKVPVDQFVIYTDNETWAGAVHPSEALRQYRQKTGIAAKLVVVGMTVTECSIADPADAGMLDVAGFDTATPALISDFAVR